MPMHLSEADPKMGACSDPALPEGERYVAPKPDKLVGVRHVQILLLFFCTLVAYATRVSTSVAIVAMTSTNDYGYPMFEWERSIQDTILSSFFWGYIILQVPAGVMAAKFGGKFLLAAGLLANGIVNMLIPLAATNKGWLAVCACRFAMGLTQGFLYPSIHGLLGKWTPIEERGRLGTFVYAGAQLGTVIEMMMSGILSASRWGWPSVYYSVGVCCLIWTFFWCIFGSNSPSESRFITTEERLYIETSTGSESTQKKIPIPWGEVCTSLPFWALFIAHCGQSLGYWTLLTEIPSYMNSVLGVDIKSNGLLSALPYVCMYIVSLVISCASDTLINKKIVSVTTARKIGNTIAFWGPAAALLVLSYLPAGHLALAVVILCVTVGLNGAHYVGFMMVHIDLAPNFASTLMGITNGFSNIFAIMAPLSVSFVIADETLASEWRKVFFISVAFYFLGNLFFILFGTSKVQPWNEPKKTETTDQKEGDKEKKVEGA